MKKTFISMLALISAALLLAGCAATDVVLKYSQGSLDAIAGAHPTLVKQGADGDYYLSVDGETALVGARDYGASASEDIAIKTPLQPFLDAGLDVARLGEGYRADETALYLSADYGDGTGAKDSLTKAVFESVAYERRALSYHQELDHYGIQLPGGKFEWAKDYKKNDKDIVFVIAAAPLAAIGVDVENIEGWAFTTMKDESGGDFDVLLKPYDLQ